jgi:hypothetical protein
MKATDSRIAATAVPYRLRTLIVHPLLCARARVRMCGPRRQAGPPTIALRRHASKPHPAAAWRPRPSPCCNVAPREGRTHVAVCRSHGRRPLGTPGTRANPLGLSPSPGVCRVWGRWPHPYLHLTAGRATEANVVRRSRACPAKRPCGAAFGSRPAAFSLSGTIRRTGAGWGRMGPIYRVLTTTRPNQTRFTRVGFFSPCRRCVSSLM